MIKKLYYFFLTALLLPVFPGFQNKVSAQLLGCPPEWAIGGVPSRGWKRNPLGVKVVEFWLEPNFDDTQERQIRLALSRWAAASAATCLKVSFQETTISSK